MWVYKGFWYNKEIKLLQQLWHIQQLNTIIIFKILATAIAVVVKYLYTLKILHRNIVGSTSLSQMRELYSYSLNFL